MSAKGVNQAIDLGEKSVQDRFLGLGVQLFLADYFQDRKGRV